MRGNITACSGVPHADVFRCQVSGSMPSMRQRGSHMVYSGDRHLDVPRVVACAMLALLLLSGCATGIRISHGGAASPTRTILQPPLTGGTSIRPCPGPLVGATDIPIADLVLTNTAHDSTGTISVGQIVQVRLPSTQHWTLTSVTNTAQQVPPAGAEPNTLGACVWSFRATQPGTITISFVGTALCDPGIPCAQYALLQTFTVNVR